MKKSTISRIEAIAVWWTVFFLLFLLIILFLPGKNKFTTLIIPAIPCSLALSIAFYFIGLKTHEKIYSHNFKTFKEILTQKGPCPECIDELRLMLKQKSSNKNMIYTSMAEIYLEMDENEKASEAVDNIDTSKYFENSATSNRMLIAGYYRISLLRYIALKDKQSCKREYENGKPYFDEFINEKPYDIIIKLMMVSYNRLFENYSESMRILQSIDCSSNAEVKKIVMAENAFCLRDTGKLNEAEKILNELVKDEQKEYLKKNLQKELEKLNKLKLHAENNS